MNELQQGLMIAGIGMGLVFGVIIFLWGLMALMMRLTSRKEATETTHATAEVSNEPVTSEPDDEEGRRRAAAAAVAVGLAMAALKHLEVARHDQGTSTGVSAWQSFHRTQQMETKTK